MYKDMPDWAEICESNFTYDNGRRAELIVCNGTCKRHLRPLSCRIFPLIPYAKRGEKLKIIMDIRAGGVCPLVKAMRLKDLNPFEKYMRSAGYGEGLVKNNEFISAGLCPEAF